MLILDDLLLGYGLGALVGLGANIWPLRTIASPRDVDWEDAPKIERKPDDWSSEIAF